MTSLQLEPSAHAPCTNTTSCASTGFPAWARPGPVRNVVESAATAAAARFTSIVMISLPSLQTPFHSHPLSRWSSRTAGNFSAAIPPHAIDTNG
jgi:hypothetical protein